MQTRSEVINEFGEDVGEKLIEAGYAGLTELMNATDGELLAISGIGKVTLEKIREKAPSIQAQIADVHTAVPQGPERYLYDTDYRVVEPFGGYEPGDVVCNLSRKQGQPLLDDGVIELA